MLAFLQYPWTVVHYIDDKSPLAAYVRVGADGSPMPTPAMEHDHVEIIVHVIGTAASTGNAFESRISYIPSSIRCGHRFVDALTHRPGQRTLTVDLDQLSETVPEDPEDLLLPQCYS